MEVLAHAPGRVLGGLDQGIVDLDFGAGYVLTEGLLADLFVGQRLVSQLDGANSFLVAQPQGLVSSPNVGLDGPLV